MFRKILVAAFFMFFIASLVGAQEGIKFAPQTAEEWKVIGESVLNATQAQIAFEMEGTIYVINADGTNVRRLVDGRSPSFSPNGRRIAYVQERWHIAILDLVSGLVDVFNAILADECEWSRDGKEIFYADGTSLSVVSVDGARNRVIYNAPPTSHGILGISVSFDNEMITFSSLGGEEIDVINADGSGFKSIAGQAGGGISESYDSPSFFPDGRIAYAYYYSTKTRASNDESIRVMNSDGTGKQVLLGSGLYGQDNVSVSPDGSTIVFYGSSRLSHGLLAVNTDGSNFRMVFRSFQNIHSPSWFDPRTRVTIFPKWDVDKSGTVDIRDLVLVARDFGGGSTGSPSDVNGDGAVDITDLVLVARHFGEAIGGVLAASSKFADVSRADIGKVIELLSGADFEEGEKTIIIGELKRLGTMPEVKPRDKMATTWGALKKP